jgi:citrate lyase subunit beta/citryl-CoA lyase
MAPDALVPPRLRRSALFMPASNARAIEKAKGLACDVVILDLEDAVAPDMKATARAAAAEAVSARGFGGRELVIRANALDTPWAADDLAAAASARPDAVLLPKVSSAEDIAAARALLGPGPQLWAMIETCLGIERLPQIAAAAGPLGLTTFVVGPNDLAKELRCRPGADRAPLLPVLSRILVSARAHAPTALDGVCNAIDDAPRLAAECEQGRALGFDGKTLIHPAQIDDANRSFGPSPEDIDWARQVAQAFAAPENAGKGAIRVAGEMVERLHLAEAERTLAIAALPAD